MHVAEDGPQSELEAPLDPSKTGSWPPLPVTQLESGGAGQKGHLSSSQGTKAGWFGQGAEGTLAKPAMN